MSQGYQNKPPATVLTVLVTAPETCEEHPQTGVVTRLFLYPHPLPGTYCLVFTPFHSIIFILLVPALLVSRGWLLQNIPVNARGSKDHDLGFSACFEPSFLHQVSGARRKVWCR